MYTIKNYYDNDDTRIIARMGAFEVLEFKRDLSVQPYQAATEFFSSKLGIRRRQLICHLPSHCGIVLQAGAMQWTVGNVEATTGVKGVGDFLGKLARGAVTNESAVKPEYKGDGDLICEPTYKHLILMDTASWGGSVVLDDGLFLACESTLKHSTVARSNLSSALAGGKGLFNLSLSGKGVFCIESDCPREELIEIELQNDVVKIDGSYAIAWSRSLEFTTERSGKTLIGSAASGEGLVNTYRGSGKVLMMPVCGDTPPVITK